MGTLYLLVGESQIGHGIVFLYVYRSSLALLLWRRPSIELGKASVCLCEKRDSGLGREGFALGLAQARADWIRGCVVNATS